MILQRIAISLSSVLSVGLALALLVGIVPLPLGVAAALCHVFGGPKIMPKEAAAPGGIVAVLAIALAAMQVAMLMADGTVKHTIPYGD
jgi:hypothetical protein